MHVGLWTWCVTSTVVTSSEATSDQRHELEACVRPALNAFPGWWRGCQTLSVVGSLMGVLACVCAGLEIHYARRGTSFSGLAVLTAICCFVAAVGMGLSHGLFVTRYASERHGVLHMAGMGGDPLPAPPMPLTLPPTIAWAFGLGAAAATIVGTTGVLLVFFVTRTYPAYHRAQNVVV